MNYTNNESGAVTVDWVVLTASIVGLGLATMAVVSSGVQDAAEDTKGQLSNSGAAIFTSFSQIAQSIGFSSDDGGITAGQYTNGGDAFYVNAIGSDGNPGYLQVDDNLGGTSYINLANTFQGDHSGKYGGSISFDTIILDNGGMSVPANIGEGIRITGANGDQLTYDSMQLASDDGNWHSTSVSLDASAGWTNQTTGLAATEAEMRAVLSDVSNIDMRTDYVGGIDDSIGVDNIKISAS